MGNVGTPRTFNEALERAGISKAELARRFDMNPRTLIGWHDDAPAYALAYLEILIECNRWKP